MNIINVRELSKTYGPRTLFKDLAFTIQEGEKVAIIGSNGCGKSTLFRILAGVESADEGIVSFKRDATISFLSQNPKFSPESTPRDIVAEAIAPLRRAIERFDELADLSATAQGADLDRVLAEQADVQNTIEQGGGWAWEHRVESVLLSLGLKGEALSLPASALSGGQRRRVALAQAFLLKPDLLILDEPTNHLDTETVEKLEATLDAYKGAILFVTHDRYFLDRVAQRILEFDPHEGLISHPGNYSTYVERRIERMDLLATADSKRKQAFKHELAWLRRSPKARTTKSRSRIKRANALREEIPGETQKAMQLQFTAEKKLGGVILEVDNVKKSYGNQHILQGIDFKLRREDKIAIIGPNGCGKSTLIKILMGEETPDSGTVKWGNKTQISYLSQVRVGLNPSHTVFEALSDTDMLQIGDRSVHKHTYLKDFLFTYDEQQKKTSTLSGGEQCRLLLAKMMLEGANFIILDEPTNDLDILSLQCLESALSGFDGCVLVITHDRYLVNRICNTLLVFEEGKFTRYDGDYDFYSQRRDARLKEEARALSNARKKAQNKKQTKVKNPPKKLKKLSFKEKKELENMEETLLVSEKEKEAIEAQLADPDLYQKRSGEVPGIQATLAKIEAKISTLYKRWEELDART